MKPRAPAAQAAGPFGAGTAGPQGRRACLASLVSLATAPALLVPGQAHAGAQLEEPLADAVRTALSAAIFQAAPPVPDFSTTKARLAYVRWLTTMAGRLRPKIADRNSRVEFLQTLWYESHRAGLDESLVLGLVQVESNFRKFAVSWVGARGYMQVMPFWTRTIGNGDPASLFNMQTNLRFGCVILRFYLDRERGDTFMALGRYNGSRGRSPYPDAVFGAQKNWRFEDRPAG